MDEERVQWEYGTLRGNEFSRGNGLGNGVETSLTKLGEEGWEGYAATSGGTYPAIYLKRKKTRTRGNDGYSR